MPPLLTYTGQLSSVEKRYTAGGKAFLTFLLDDKPFRYFAGDEEHMDVTLQGLHTFMTHPVTVEYYEKWKEGNKYPFRNVENFKTVFTAAGDIHNAGGQTSSSTGDSGSSSAAPGADFNKMQLPDLDGTDYDMQLMRSCFELADESLRLTRDRLKEQGIELTGGDVLRCLQATAATLYITKRRGR